MWRRWWWWGTYLSYGGVLMVSSVTCCLQTRVRDALFIEANRQRLDVDWRVKRRMVVEADRPAAACLPVALPQSIDRLRTASKFTDRVIQQMHLYRLTQSQASVSFEISDLLQGRCILVKTQQSQTNAGGPACY